MSYPTMSTSVPWSLVQSGFRKTPHFNTVIPSTVTRRGVSAYSLTPYPTWDFQVDLESVLGGEAVQGSVLQAFLGCYMACHGRAGLFVFTDPNDSAVANTQGVLLNCTPGAAAPMGQKGDGSSKVFQLARTIGQGVDILQTSAITQLRVGGVAKTSPTNYSVSSTGVVTFVTAPANNAVLDWAGTFSYLCRFADDTLGELGRISKNAGGFLWSCPSVSFGSEFV